MQEATSKKIRATYQVNFYNKVITVDYYEDPKKPNELLTKIEEISDNSDKSIFINCRNNMTGKMVSINLKNVLYIERIH